MQGKHLVRRIGKGIWGSVKLVVLFVLVVSFVVGIGLYIEYAKPVLELKKRASDIAEQSTIEDFRSSMTSVVYDSNGEKISTLRSGKSLYYLTYEELPRYAIDVMLVTEDRRFYSHEGVDLVANVRAFYYLIKNRGEITQGGSTITQQLTRTIYLSNEVSYERKLVEVFLAWELEKKYSKDEIMEFYLNNIYFANGYYGIQAAAYGYFGRSVKDLSLSEIVFLCAIPNNPSLYDPYRKIENTLERRNRMLLQMLQEEKITQTEYQMAIAEEIVLGKAEVTSHNYVETYAYYCAVRALMEADGFVFCTDFSSEEEQVEYEERYEASYSAWQQKLYTGGYRIYTSIDLEKQELLQQSVQEVLQDFTQVNEEGIYEMQASAVCIDNETGYVVAIVGGREQEYAGYTLNRAYQSFRQPGSCIKPLIVYTPWLERGLTPDSLVLDEKFEGGPDNAGAYHGVITVRTAVEQSKNTVAWKLFEELTPQVGLSYLKKMQFQKIVESDFVPAASLGGLTYGVSTLEMASAFAALENDGVFRNPTCIVRITDVDGTAIVENLVKEQQVYEQNAARTMTDMLKGVLTVGTARKHNLENAIAAGKTGTTNQGKDSWFVGYTAYYTTSVWVGYDWPKGFLESAGNSYSLMIWEQYMEQIHEGLELVDFPEYHKETGTYQAPDITITPIPEKMEEVVDNFEENQETTPTPDNFEENDDAVTPTPASSNGDDYRVTPTPSSSDGENYRVTPPPVLNWGEEDDPTKDP